MEITHYTSSDGKLTPIVELNPFHLTNALIKLSGVIALNPNGFGDAKEEYDEVTDTHKALKAEVLRRMLPEIKAEDIPF